MKWFKHYSDSYSNFKLQRVVSEFGLRGYGLFWICVEVVAQQGEKSRIKEDKCWKKTLAYITRESEEELEKILTVFAEVNLIDKKGLEIGDLYLPKIRDYSDEYTDKLRRVSRQSRENVGLDKIRRDKNRLDKNIFDEFWSAYPRKENKKKARDIWERKNIGNYLQEILEFIPKAAATDRWKKGMIPHPTTFLNGERWTDDLSSYRDSQPVGQVENKDLILKK